jgi:hypothetical protein
MAMLLCELPTRFSVHRRSDNAADLGVAAVRIKKPTIGITVIGGDRDAAA